MLIKPTSFSSLLASLALCFCVATTCVAQKFFPTAEQAAQALLVAAEADDMAALYLLFGTQGKEILESGDPVQDRNHRAAFVAKAKQAMKVQRDRHHQERVLVLIGDDENPFAVPLVAANGQWRFDTQQGRVEILARRIGSNEFDAIDACVAYVQAQHKYASEDHDRDGIREYARQFISSPGKQDGLYWPESSEASASPIAEFIAHAIEEGYTGGGEKPVPYHGYYFRILTSQGPNAQGGARDYLVRGLMIGGFGLIARPAEYGASGIKTFIVNHDGTIYEKDLGPHTTAAANAVARFDPDNTWNALR